MAYDVASTERYIREAARRRGIDPDVAVRVAKSEGLARNTWQSNLVKGGQREPSFGPFQLLVGGDGTNYPAGMGNDFKSATGLDPSDPSNVNATIDYALDRASKDGWGAWYGAAKVGVGKRTGIGGNAAPVGRAPAMGGSAPAASGNAPGVDPMTTASTSPAPAAGPMIQIGAEKSNKLHEAMVARAMQQGGSARNGWDAMGALAQVWAGSDKIKKNDAANESSLAQAMAGANLDPSYAMAAQLGGDRGSLANAILAQQENRTATTQRDQDREWKQDEREYQRGQDTVANQRADATLELQREKANQPAEQPSSVREYEYAKTQGFGGSYAEWEQQNRKAGATVVNSGQDEGEFQKKAAARMVERFGTVADAGTGAANVKSTIPVMRELLTQAPTGPLAGRLAEAYPGFSTAGDAFMATVNQVAPSLRIPGSGAQSDRDMDILLGSFPRLRNESGSNAIIMDVFERKADLNLQRSQIATAALRGDIKPEEADRQLSALDQTPLFDDGMRQRLGLGSAPAPANGSAEPSPHAAAPVRRARNPETGEIVELRNGQWVPAQ